MGFNRATSGKDAEWVEKALSEGEWTRVSSVVPVRFEAYAAILYPAWHCVCTAKSISEFVGEWTSERPIRRSEVANASVPVIWHYAPNVLGMQLTQYRRLGDGSWITDDLSRYGALAPLIRPGDEWIGEPGEGSLDPELAMLLTKLLDGETATPESCWFGVWEGYGGFSDSQRAGPAVSIPERRWLLFRAPLTELTTSIETLCEPRSARTSIVLAAGDTSTLETQLQHSSVQSATASELPQPVASLAPQATEREIHFQSANMVWPEDRSWFLAVEIDLSCALIAGSEALVSRLLNEPELEGQAVRTNDRFPNLGDVLQPVIDKPSGLSVQPGFESRTPPPEWLAVRERARELDARLAENPAEFLALLRRLQGRN